MIVNRIAQITLGAIQFVRVNAIGLTTAQRQKGRVILLRHAHFNRPLLSVSIVQRNQTLIDVGFVNEQTPSTDRTDKNHHGKGRGFDRGR